MSTNANKRIAGTRWPPQISLLLDENARILSINRSLAGNSFPASDRPGQAVHDVLHGSCAGDCRFKALWEKAWACIPTRDAMEWEVDDVVQGRLLRLNLSKPPAPSPVARDRRQAQYILTITDITVYRREYESLRESQEALLRLLASEARQGQVSLDDTGSRLLAEYTRHQRSNGRQLILAQEDERKRIALELHDGIAQMVGGLKFRMESTVAKFAKEHPDMELGDLQSVVSELKDLVGEIRRISRNLAPSMLEDFGIQVSIEWLCKDFATRHPEVEMTCNARVDEGTVPELVKIAAYRIVQEALNNAAKHSSATKVDVSLGVQSDALVLQIADNGEGFPPQKQKKPDDEWSGLGLRSMRERAEATGGTCTFEDGAGKGVTVSVTWPADALLGLSP